ncbi:DUF6457 domain-containing protein [Corynebacterium bouchesdurhonense]|uniref:DUF6457 domain-containing protein n=1 Tax=Corynebacterium bouchesdurhonense TaxID=1720192 RepID=UPI0008312FCC|nr:DUF6457 domain-containing protein [Corynebacterium bouchesdurhonense]
MSEKEPLRTTHEWLDAVSRELGVDPQLTRELVGDVLDMTAAVAPNGPARPAAPLTAFVLGFAAARQDQPGPDPTRALIGQVTELLGRYDSPAARTPQAKDLR